MPTRRLCPVCDADSRDIQPDSRDAGTGSLSRRDFVRVTAAAAAMAGAGTLATSAMGAPEQKPQPEKLVESLYKTLTPDQKAKMCFDWDYTDERGLLRTRVENNWSITDRQTMNVGGPFYTKDQQDIIEAIFLAMYNPDWHDRIHKQLRDDAGGYGKQQTIAIFGEPGTRQFEFVMTGRHLTIRCDGNTEPHVAFGGPIFYGHASKESPDSFNELAGHPGNVFWPQAQLANKLYQMLDGKQREQALIKVAPYEDEVGFRGADGDLPGVRIADLSRDQQEHAQEVLKTLLDPYRIADREEVAACLDAHGGLDACHLSFYQDGDIGDDGVWDIWRLEGPSFVWHFRGSPHVHVWVNVADDSSVKLNASG